MEFGLRPTTQSGLLARYKYEIFALLAYYTVYVVSELPMFQIKLSASPQGSGGYPNRSITTNLHYVTSQKSKDVIYTVVDA
jgi:hypothetical protein